LGTTKSIVEMRTKNDAKLHLRTFKIRQLPQFRDSFFLVETVIPLHNFSGNFHATTSFFCGIFHCYNILVEIFKSLSILYLIGQPAQINKHMQKNF
jgi:hypothetical protein